MNKEFETFKLSLIYRTHFKKFDQRIFTAKTITNSKWWPYFEKVIDKFCDRENWDPSVFIEAQFFFKGGKVYPPELPTEKSWKNFLDYLNYKEKESDEETTVKNALNGFSSVKNFCLKNNIPFGVSEYIDNDYNRKKIERNEIPIHFFLFSKVFNKKFNIKDDIKKTLVRSNKKLLEKIKNVLKEDYEQ